MLSNYKDITVALIHANILALIMSKVILFLSNWNEIETKSEVGELQRQTKTENASIAEFLSPGTMLIID